MTSIYDIFITGNALLEQTYCVDSEFFIQHNIPIASRALRSHPQIIKLHQHLEHPCQSITAAGSAGNTVHALSLLGLNCFFCGHVGDDENGNIYSQSLSEQGIEHNLEVNPHGLTGECLVITGEPTTHPTMMTFLGSSSNFEVDNTTLTALKNSRWMFIEGYLVANEKSFQSTLKLISLAENKNSVFTLGDVAITERFSENLWKVIQHGITVLFATRDEVLSLCQTNDLKHASNQLLKYVDTLFITFNKQGAFYVTNDEFVFVKCKSKNATNVIGAGDIFSAVCLTAMINGLKPLRCVQLANYIAGKTVERHGARLTRNEVEYISNEIRGAL